MRIPLIGVPEAPAPQQTFAPLNATTYDKAGQAGERLGQTIEGVATDLPVQIKEGIDAGVNAYADTQRRTFLQGSIDKILKGPNANNPEKWGEIWASDRQGFAEQLTQDQKVSNLSIPAKREFQVKQAQWEAESTQMIGHLATEKGLQNTQANIIDNFHTTVLAGKESEAVANMQAAIDKGHVAPAIGLPLIHQAPIESETNRAVALMAQDPNTGGGPIVMEKVLKEQNDDGTYKFYPHLQGEHREALIADAHRFSNFLRSETSQGYADRQLSKQPIDPAEVNRDVVAGKLTAAQARSILKPEKAFDSGTFGQLLSEIGAYDPDKDPDHKEEAALWGQTIEANLPAPALERAQAFLKEKMNPKSEANTPASKEGTGIISQAFENGFLGEWKTRYQDPDDPTRQWKERKDEPAWQAAQGRKSELITAFNSFIADNPKTTPDQARQFIFAQMAPMRQARNASRFNPPEALPK